MYQVQFSINYTSELHEGKLSAIVLVSLTIAKFISLSDCSFVACTYATFEYLIRMLFHVDKLINITILRKYSGNDRA